MKKKYKSDAFECIHETAAGLFKAGLLSAAEMKKYDKSCLVQEEKPVQLTPRPKTAAVAALSHSGTRNRK